MYMIVVTAMSGMIAQSQPQRLPETYRSLSACERMVVSVAKQFVPKTNRGFRFNCEHVHGNHR